MARGEATVNSSDVSHPTRSFETPSQFPVRNTDDSLGVFECVAHLFVSQSARAKMWRRGSPVFGNEEISWSNNHLLIVKWHAK